jgi:hypothetical protein
VPRKPRPPGGVKGHNMMINHCREAPRCARGTSNSSGSWLAL